MCMCMIMSNHFASVCRCVVIGEDLLCGMYACLFLYHYQLLLSLVLKGEMLVN